MSTAERLAEELPWNEGRRFWLLNAAPSWLTSLIVHVCVLLALALMTFRIDPDVVHTILSSQPILDEYDIPKFKPLPQPVPPLPDPSEEELLPEQPAPELPEPEQQWSLTPETDPAEPGATDIDLGEIGEIAAIDGNLDIPSTGPGDDVAGQRENARRKAGRNGDLTGPSEEAVARALKWLAAHQQADGSWSFDHRRGTCQGRCGNPGTLDHAHNGATALALLPFLGASQTHRSGVYQDTVQRGLAYLLRRADIQRSAAPRADWSEPGGTMYSHGLAAIVMCEAYALTNDRSLIEPAQMAINQIAYAQDPVGGGWRYQVHQPGDTSVVGWQLMALKSGTLAYLAVPPETVRGASRFLDATQTESGARYGYTGPGTGAGTSSVGLLSRMLLGWKRDNGALERGVAWLDQQGPSRTNLYYDYYATQVMRHYEGEPWQRWNPKMRDFLVEAQARNGHQTGSWYVGGDHGSQRGGRLYCTAMAAMILEVYYRVLPIYGNQAAEEDFPL